MARAWWVVGLAGLTLAAPAPAAALRFHWQVGQVLNYKVEQVTTASEVVDGKKAETTSKLNNVKSWKVLAVDAAGVATLELSLTSLRVETAVPGGDVLLFDSANPEGSTAQLREQLSKYVGVPLAVLRVDGLGKVVEVQECKHGPASRYESEPPFVLTLPEGDVAAGQSWERQYQITLEPPQGTGEKYKAVQKYACQALDGGAARIGLSTTITTLPESLLDQVPLLQMMPEGGVLFDGQSGRMYKAVLKVEKELKGQQGEGSTYQVKSTYTEQYVGGP